MGALGNTRLTTVAAQTPSRGDYPIKANVWIKKGGKVALDSAGRAMPAGTLAGGSVEVVGKSSAEYDNRTGSTLGGAADACSVSVEFGVVGWDNSVGDPVTVADVGKVVYSEDDHTTARTGSATLPRDGILTEVKDGQAYVWQGPHVVPIAEAVALAEAGVALQKRTLTVGHADLTDAVNGEAQSINIGAALPANARILGVDLRLATPFTGGGAATVVLDIGTAGDKDAIVAAADVKSAAVDGEASTRPAGIAPNKLLSAAQLLATFTPDGAHTLDGLTAGSVVIDVLFAALA